LGKTYRKHLAAVLSFLMTIAMLALGPVSAHADAQFPIVQSFTGGTAPGWTWGGGASLGGGWLTLTRALTGQMGYAYYNDPFPSSLGIVVEFDYATWGGNGADGTSFFLFDGATAFSPGPVGGALGYAARPASGQNGVGHAYVGIGLDEYGNFSNPGDGLIDGPGFFPNNVVIRGAGNGTSGYNFLTRAATSLAANRTTPSHIQMTITKDKKITVRRMAPGASTYTTLINNYQMTTTPPATFKLGFVASTGSLTNNHEIRNLTVAAPVELPLTLTSSVGSAKVVGGQSITYTATISNTGLNDADGAALALTPSAGLENLTWTCTASGGGACASAAGTGDATLNLPTGASATLAIQANVAASASGTVSLTAAAQAPSGFVNTSNSATATLTNAVVAPPVAHPQAVSLEMNTSAGITLTGSDPAAMPLTYAVAAPPAHGTLSGSAPNLTYTPAPGFFGSDSFDFTVNNGYLDSAPAAVSISVVDTVLPTITGAPDRQPDHNGWYNQPVTVSFTCADSGSGIAACNQPVTLADGAGQMVTGYASDNAGNTAAAFVGPLDVDTTAPTIQGAPDRAANAAGWYNGDVTVSFTCADALSGVASCANPVNFSEGQGQSASGTAADNAGNSASATVSGINIDKTAPATTISAPGGWVNHDVTVSLTATDNLSGVAATYHRVDGGILESGPDVGLTTEGIHTIEYWSEDQAGNVEGAQHATVRIDLTAPTIAGAPDRAPNSYGWYNAPVTVTFTCADGLSGVAACSGPVTLSAEGAAQSATGTAADMAGNSASATVGPISIDMTAPAVTYTGAGTYTVDQTVSVTCTATDSLSGVASTTCAGVTGDAWSLGLGSHTLSATATDKAGNTGSGSATYTVAVTADSLCQLTKRFVTQDGIANSLCVKLAASAQQAAQGNTKAANNTLAAYVNEVSAQTGKAFGSMEAGVLTQLARALMH
jgi:uncharacterized repeat protein (TIGR01451 family)